MFVVSETVAIISVSASALVGVGGLVAAVSHARSSPTVPECTASMSVVHVVASTGHSEAYYALAGALGGAVVTGILGIIGLSLQSLHENARLQKKLNHERDQQDLEVLRTILGDASEALGEVRTAFIRLLRYVHVGAVGSETARRDDAMAQQRAAAAATRSALDRMRLQLPPDDAVMKAYEAVMQTLDKVADLVQQRSSDYKRQIEAIDPTLKTQTEEFISLARARVGPRATVETR